MSVSILLFGWQTDRLESINWGSSLQHALIKGVVAIIQEHYYRVEMWQWQKKKCDHGAFGGGDFKIE